MSRTIPRRLAAQLPFTVTTESITAFRLPLRCLRPFSHTSRTLAVRDDIGIDPSYLSRKSTSRSTPSPKSSPTPLSLRSSLSSLDGLAQLLSNNTSETAARRREVYNPNQNYEIGETIVPTTAEKYPAPHLFSVYATRHNTHINVSAPYQDDPKKSEAENEALRKKHPYNVMMTLSAGNLGFRHSARKHYDSAFQVASVVMERMQSRGMNEGIKKLEVHLRGFGAGREAVTKALLGSEGRFLRGKIVKVADNTRLKFGGTRSKKPRRLG